MKSIIVFSFFISVFFNTSIFANEATDWLSQEIDIILNAYKNPDLPNENKFLMVEQTINNNFAGAGIAKFVSGKAWNAATKEIKKAYIKLFKRHLALNIASMMQSYSNQNYSLINSRYDENSKVTLVDMLIHSDNNDIQVTWRLKKSKDRFFVIDLLVADISLVVTKRSEFNSMLKTVDYDLLEFNKILSNKNEISYQKIIS